EPMNLNLQLSIFGIVLVLAGTMFTSNIFADIGDKNKSVSALTLPASHFEKYLLGWLYSFVLFQLVYLAIYPPIIALILNTRHWSVRFEVFNIFHERAAGWVLLLYAFLNSVAMCGAIFFKKLHFIKTAFIFFIGLMFLSLVNKSVVEVMLGKNIISAVPFAYVNFPEGHNYFSISPSNNLDVFFVCLTLTLSFILWTAAYFSLTEKQV
ncbi:MAG: hypothetical protein ACXVA2_04395, partial [Mucilaginibacter sp.]